MPSFILRDLEPVFWSRVQAKAAAEGVTPKAVILKLLTQWLGTAALLVVVLLLAGCAPPLAPAPVVVAPPARVPASITLEGGHATAADQVLLNLRVADDRGTGIADVVVTLTTTAGTLNHATVQTGPTGTAQALLTTTTDATVTAQSGELTATAEAKAVPEPPPPPTCATDPTYCAAPTPKPPPPPPPPVVPVPVLHVSLSCTEQPALTPTPCNLTVTYRGAPVLALTDVDWTWGDGDQTLNETDPVDAHPYPQPGAYTVFVAVTASTTDGPKSAAASQGLDIP